jgi:hypothetical protein
MPLKYEDGRKQRVILKAAHHPHRHTVSTNSEIRRIDDYTWCTYAAKLERKGSLYLGLDIEEQVMVTIRRELTAKAQRRFDEEHMVAAAKREASKRKAELDKAERGRLQLEAPKRKADEAMAKWKKEEKEKRRRLEEEKARLKAEIKKLEKEKQSNLGQKTGKAQMLESIEVKEAGNDSWEGLQILPQLLGSLSQIPSPKNAHVSIRLELYRGRLSVHPYTLHLQILRQTSLRIQTRQRPANRRGHAEVHAWKPRKFYQRWQESSE